MEKNLWKQIRNELNDFFIQRIETAIERGIPDVYYLSEGHSGWIEGKYIKQPKRKTTKLKVKITIEQIAWHFALKRHGGISYFLVKKVRDVYLFKGSHGRALAKGITQDEFEKTAIAKGWSDIKNCIVKNKNFII